MFNWQYIKELHFNKKLEVLIHKWFQVGLLYVDNHGNIDWPNDEDENFNNFFLKLQNSLPFGKESIKQDVQEIAEDIKNKPNECYYYPSLFQPVRYLACKIEIEGEVLGTIVAYPYISDQFTSKDKDAFFTKFKEAGATDEDTQQAFASLKKLKLHEYEYLRELLLHMSTEVGVVYQELVNRERRISDLNSELSTKYRFHNIIGKSKPMQQIYNLLNKVSSSDATILIQGENGTGKEMVAKAIHFNSTRKDSVFLAVNCSAFNDNLLDSELFGHVKGSFTGAVKDKRGFFEVANGGTLFLDEIGDMSLSMQVKLLRVLQEGTYLPVGATQARRVNVRVLAATNKPLKEMIEKGEFREDLYYRINVINLNIPSLRDRSDDIPILMDYFLKNKCEEVGKSLKKWSQKSLEMFMNYNWPGNVRELQNEVERLVILSGDEEFIKPELVSESIARNKQSGSLLKGITSNNIGSNDLNFLNINVNGSLRDALEKVEAYMIEEGLKRCNFNKSKLSKELGISRAGLIMKVDKYDLDKRKKASGE